MVWPHRNLNTVCIRTWTRTRFMFNNFITWRCRRIGTRSRSLHRLKIIMKPKTTIFLFILPLGKVHQMVLTDVPLSHHFASIAVAVEVILLKMEPNRAKYIFEKTTCMKDWAIRVCDIYWHHILTEYFCLLQLVLSYS